MSQIMSLISMSSITEWEVASRRGGGGGSMHLGYSGNGAGRNRGSRLRNGTRLDLMFFVVGSYSGSSSPKTPK